MKNKERQQLQKELLDVIAKTLKEKASHKTEKAIKKIVKHLIKRADKKVPVKKSKATAGKPKATSEIVKYRQIKKTQPNNFF